jgi:hypothetical protein
MIVTRTLKALVLALALALSGLGSGCVEPDLGDAPVFCNEFEPRCPEGYTCQRQGEDEVCVREGAALDEAADDADGGR